MAGLLLYLGQRQIFSLMVTVHATHFDNSDAGNISPEKCVAPEQLRLMVSNRASRSRRFNPRPDMRRKSSRGSCFGQAAQQR
jgi:hypothetical protein